MISFISNTFQCDFIYFKYISNYYIGNFLFQMRYVSYRGRLNVSMCQVARTKESVEECNAKAMAKVATLTGDLVEANTTIKCYELRKADLSSRISALRQQLDMTVANKDHASTQTGPLPSDVTSPSLVASPQSPPLADDAPDMPPDSPSDGGKSAFCRPLKYKRKLGAVI